MKEKNYVNDWCVQITEENKKDVREYLTNSNLFTMVGETSKSMRNWTWSEEAYYGITEKGNLYGNKIKSTVSNNLLSSREFYQMVNRSKIDNYTMY